MKILNQKMLEDCFNETFMKEILFDMEIKKEFIDFIAQGALLQYFPDFARPFYRIDLKGKYIIKGIEGNKTLQIFLNRDCAEESLQFFKNVVAKHKQKEQ